MTPRWTWDAAEHPHTLDSISGDDWCDRLESSAGDAVSGKVLCVCAALAVARLALGASPAPRTAEALCLLAAWIDEPTDECCARISDALFGDEANVVEPHVAWWALRAATSSVGNYEAGWALSGACAAANDMGVTADAAREAARRGVSARRA